MTKSPLLRVQRKPAPAGAPLDDATFPFSVPAVRSLECLELGTPVAFFVGENGSGKSTLLEAIAIAAELITLGEIETASDPTLVAQRRLAATLRLAWAARTRRGFFLRAEDFFGYLKAQSRIDARMSRERREIDGPLRAHVTPEPDATYRDHRDAARFIARYDARSHGESFLDLFEQRVRPGGLYLLDEPEAPLSPARQMAFVTLLHERAAQGAQFVIATHSPLLLACPGARIYDFDRTPIGQTEYESLEHVKVTRRVLEDPARATEEIEAGHWARAPR